MKICVLDGIHTPKNGTKLFFSSLSTITFYKKLSFFRFMEQSTKSLNRIYSDILFISLMFLFFFQLVSDLVETIYSICLANLSSDDVVSLILQNALPVLFFLAPIIFIFYRKGIPEKLLLITGFLVIVSRMLEGLLTLQFRSIFAGLGVGSFLIFLPTFFLQKKLKNKEKDGLSLGIGLAIALALLILFRTLGLTLDISSYGVYQIITWSLASIEIIMLIILNKNITAGGIDLEDKNAEIRNSPDGKWKIFGKILGITFGMTNIFILIYFVFSNPTVLSRWVEGNYLAIVIISIIMVISFILIATLKPEIITKLKPWIIVLWNCLFVITLVLTIIFNQTIFPIDSSSFPIDAPATSLLQQIPLYILLVLSPIILIDMVLFSRTLLKTKLTPWKIGASFTITSLFFLLMIFSVIFTLLYEYIPEIAFFRDMFWAVIMIIGLLAVLPILVVKKNSLVFSRSITNFKKKLTIASIFGLIAIGTIIGGIITESYPATPPSSISSIKIMAYNIQQGVDTNGNGNFDGQLSVIREANADIIGLEESDTCRITGGNSDIVRYIANNLNLYSYYGPKTVTGTWGVALLSKYPIQNAKTFYMFSEGEQTACIHAQILINSITYNIFVTHLGNQGPINQQEEILSRIQGNNNIILMGDFNFKPNTSQYNITVATLKDSWENATSSILGNIPVGFTIGNRIDHIFVSNETIVNECVYFGGQNSDHPALSTEINV